MANEITGNVWYLDTVGDVVYNQINISTFLVSPSAGNFVVILKDKNGKIVLNVQGATGDPIAVPVPGCTVEGLKVDTLTNAVVTVYK